MENKVVIVTGANGGIGYETAMGIAKAGYILIMACRNMEKAEIAREKISGETGNNNVYIFQLDLASFKSIRSFCGAVKGKFKKIDILVNNAGVFTMEHGKTEDGLELTMGINFFGTFLLTNLLLPLFDGANDPKIINVTSDAYKMGDFSIDSIEKRDTTSIKAYSASKRALMMFTLELAERSKGISINAVHPGHVNSGIWNFKKWYAFIIKFFSKFSMVSSYEGAKPVLNLVLSEDVKGKSGRYFYQFVETPVKNCDSQLRCRLWEKAKTIVGLTT